MPPEIWEEISRRPRFIPLSSPKNNEECVDKVQYEDYENIKSKNSIEFHRPRNNFNNINTNALKASDSLPSKSTKAKDGNIKVKLLWHKYNLRYTITCQNFLRRRCIFAWRIVDEDFNMRLDDLKSVIENPLYNYQCGDNLFGFEGNPITHQESTNIFHVRNNFACYMSVKKLYFQK